MRFHFARLLRLWLAIMVPCKEPRERFARSEVEWEYTCQRVLPPPTILEMIRVSFITTPGFAATVGRARIRLAANPWKLFDMYGNVREWVGNSFVNTLLDDSEQDEFRISRGGSCRNQRWSASLRLARLILFTIGFGTWDFGWLLERPPTPDRRIGFFSGFLLS